MRTQCQVVGVTYGEFQAWYLYGEMQLLRGRLVDISFKKSTDEPDGECSNVKTLLERLPSLSLEDEEGVLFVQMMPNRDVWRNSEDRQTVIASIKAIKRVIPLTDRARRILEPRLSPLGVNLAEPYFCSQVREAWYQAGVDTARKAGDALVEMVIEDGCQFIGENIHKAVAPAIRAIDHEDEPTRSEDSKEDNSWIAAAFRWTRHKPYDDGNFNYLHDAGNVLKAWGDPWLKPYRDAIKSLKKQLDTAEPLENILSRREFKDAADKLKSLKPDAFPAGLSSLVLFLRWKEQFHERGECVDVMDLAKEAKQSAPAVGIKETAAAVWLIGCFAGHERLATAVYAADADSYEWFAGERLEVEKASLPASDPEGVEEGEASASADAAPPPECKSAAEGKAGASEDPEGDGSDGATADAHGKPVGRGEEGASDSLAPVTNDTVEAEAHGSPPSARERPGASEPKDSPQGKPKRRSAVNNRKTGTTRAQKKKESGTGNLQSQSSFGFENKPRSAED